MPGAKKNKRIYAFILSLITVMTCVLAVFPSYALAEPTELSCSVMKNVSPSVMLSCASCIIDDMTSYTPDAEGSLLADEVFSVDETYHIESAPYRPFVGDKCLAFSVEAQDAADWHGISKKYQSMATSFGTSLVYTVNCLEDSGTVYTKARIYCGDEYIETSERKTEPGCWNSVICDIPEGLFPYTDGAEIYFRTEGADSVQTYYADLLMLAEASDIRSVFSYMSDSYYIYGGAMSYSDECMTLELNGTNPYIESYGTRSIMMDAANSVMLTLSNNTGCRSIRLYYSTDDEPYFTEAHCSTAQLGTSGGVQLCYIHIPDEVGKICQMRLIFEGSISGDIKIYSISPASGYFDTENQCSIESCNIAEDKQTLELTASIKPSVLEKYKNAQVCLLEHTVYGTAQYSAVAYADIGEEVSISYAPANTDALLFSSYSLGVRVGGVIKTELCTPQYVSNPEILSEVQAEHPNTQSKKGIYAELDGKELGSSHVCTDIYLDELISVTSTEYSVSCFGALYYFNADYTKSLDELLAPYAASGAEVTARILVKKNSDTSKNRYLAYSDGAGENSLCAWNIRDKNGARAIAASLRFLASRYSSGSDFGKIDNYVIGSEINDAENSFYAGDMLLCDYVGLYEKILRMSYNVIKSENKAADVYVYFGNGWNMNFPADSTRVYDNRELLENLNKCVISHGNIGWNIAYDPYPHDAAYTAFSDGSLGSGFEAENVTLGNIEVLYSYTGRNAFYYNGEYRRIILLEGRKNVNERSDVISADYIWSYCRICSPNYDRIKALIADRDVNTDDAYRYIDTTLNGQKCAFCCELLGIDDFSELTSKYGASYVSKITVMEKSFDSVHPAGTTGNISVFRIGQESLDGWTGNDGTDLGYEPKYMGYENLLRISKQDADQNTECKIYCIPEYTLDLKYTPYLQIYVQLPSLPDDASSAKIVWTVYSGKNRIEASAAADKGKWTNLIFPIGDFPQISSVDRMEIGIYSESGENLPEATVYISDIVGISDTRTGEELSHIFSEMRNEVPDVPEKEINMRIVWFLIIVIILTLTVWTVSIMTRLKKHGGEQ